MYGHLPVFGHCRLEYALITVAGLFCWLAFLLLMSCLHPCTLANWAATARWLCAMVFPLCCFLALMFAWYEAFFLRFVRLSGWTEEVERWEELALVSQYEAWRKHEHAEIALQKE